MDVTLPEDVRYTAVRPKLDPKRGIVLTIVVAAKSVDDVNQLVDNLQATGAFAEIEKRDERIDDQNQQLEATLECVYTPSLVR